MMARVFGFAEFRPRQETIIAAVLAGEDVLAVLPTGGGKSLCYQLPALTRPGLTIVVSPLIALMRDQVTRLRAAGVAAGALHSANPDGVSQAVERAIEARRLKLVYVAPERFAQPGLVDLLRRGGASLLAIDEAHCISQWGHDFRPEYMDLGQIAADLGGLQTIAVTATADAPTRAEIVERLFPRAPRVVVASFDRPNLRLAMARKTDAFRQIAEFIEARRGQSGIVYCASRDRAEKFAHGLSARGHRAVAYHAGLDPETRAAHQDEFIEARGVVMCATIAFGMGVDKPDARFVCHADTPAGLEAWYQEIGRAGRDGAPADTLALWSEDDFALRRKRLADGSMTHRRHGVALRKLAGFQALCETAACRRQALLAAFGETADPCGNCDNCARGLFGLIGARRPFVARLPASGRGALSALARLASGEATEALRRRDREAPGRLLAWLPSWRVDADPAPAPEQAPAAAVADTRAPPVEQASLTIAERRLLAALRAYRLERARAERRPAHAILADSTLLEIVARRPRDLAALAAIEGMDAPRPRDLGSEILDILRRHGTGLPDT